MLTFLSTGRLPCCCHRALSLLRVAIVAPRIEHNDLTEQQALDRRVRGCECECGEPEPLEVRRADELLCRSVPVVAAVLVSLAGGRRCRWRVSATGGSQARKGRPAFTPSVVETRGDSPGVADYYTQRAAGSRLAWRGRYPTNALAQALAQRLRVPGVDMPSLDRVTR